MTKVKKISSPTQADISTEALSDTILTDVDDIIAGETATVSFTPSNTVCSEIFRLIVYVLVGSEWIEQYDTYFQEGESGGQYEGKMYADFVVNQIGPVRYDIIASNRCGESSFGYQGFQSVSCLESNIWLVTEVCVDEPPFNSETAGCTTLYTPSEFANMIGSTWLFAAATGQLTINPVSGGPIVMSYEIVGGQLTIDPSPYPSSNQITVSFGPNCQSMTIRFTDPDTGAWVEFTYIATP